MPTHFVVPVFVPAPWLPNGHMQTVFASLMMSVPMPNYRREIIDLPDGDIVAADWVDGTLDKPLFVLIHGMEGDSESRYARLLINECQALGWSGVVLHMRSCGGLINRRRNFYHAGFYQDIAYFLDVLLPKRKISENIYLAGVSLGGSQVVHYLAKGRPQGRVKAAALISTPLDLKGSADFMKSGLNRLYILKFRQSLLKKYAAKKDLIRNDEMMASLARAKNFWDLDDAATAPLHGFDDAKHYYQEMSAKKVLPEISIPTLYLASKDDPFIPEASMPNGECKTAQLRTILTDAGGHVGFVDQHGQSWMSPTVFKYFLSFESDFFN
ncbi:MAG: alpha/beta fold hydrolase [Candidatus Marinimicrobia bacterium]|nr:alpha/beta fold hydrolase [Candidatus Neomarinimicrobiota bacterium]